MANETENKINEATGEVLRCVSEGFTGTLVMEFQGGCPMVFKKTEIKRLGRRAAQARVDAGSSPK